METEKIYGRVVEWFDSDHYGAIPLQAQHGYIRANSGTRYLVRFSDINKASEAPRKGMILRGVPEGPRGNQSVVFAEVMP
jgi:hypothetical protein